MVEELTPGIDEGCEIAVVGHAPLRTGREQIAHQAGSGAIRPGGAGDAIAVGGWREPQEILAGASPGGVRDVVADAVDRFGRQHGGRRSADRIDRHHRPRFELLHPGQGPPGQGAGGGGASITASPNPADNGRDGRTAAFCSVRRIFDQRLALARVIRCLAHGKLLAAETCPDHRSTVPSGEGFASTGLQTMCQEIGQEPGHATGQSGFESSPRNLVAGESSDQPPHFEDTDRGQHL